MDASQIADNIIVDSNPKDAEVLLPLFFGPQKEDLELLVLAAPTHEMPTPSSRAVQHSLVGHWGGSFTCHDVSWSDGLVSLTISDHAEDGNFSGSGIDAFGSFQVKGTLKGARLTFLKEYINRQDGDKEIWQCQGTVHEDDRIVGTWQPLDDENPRSPTIPDEDAHDHATPWGVSSAEDDDDSNLETSSTEDDDASSSRFFSGDDRGSTSSMDPEASLGGSFCLQRRPLEYFLACPSSHEFEQNRPLALWKLALNFAIRVVRSRTLNWRALSERRRRRQRYIELVTLQERYGRMDPARAQEWAQLIKCIHPSDLHLWQCVVTFQIRRSPVRL